MRTYAKVALIALLATASSQAFAQNQQPMDWSMMNGGMMSGGMMNGGMMHGGCSMMQSNYGPMVESRLAYVKAELAITPEQVKAWDAYVSAVKGSGATMYGQCKGMMSTMKSGSAVQRMTAHTNAMQMMLDSMKTLQPATEALYAVLDEEQKKKADSLLGSGCGMM